MSFQRAPDSEQYHKRAKTKKEVEAAKWAGGFQKLVHREASSINVQRVAVQANYFKISNPLDQINSKDIIKRELRRSLIKALLEQHSLSAIRVSDYFEYIVFVGNFYPVSSDSVGTVTNVLHYRPGQNETWRWRTEIPPNADQEDLIGLRVTFNANGINPKTRVIRGVGARDARLTTFRPKESQNTECCVSTLNHAV
ncbi:predicted protein [Sclerotinia sclerotiorum 1980 UF-70]|uniref:Uncharacterized protein n=1 Tax=Sclerotinia sclerotiorum (strain ATCC 18683 / 1980 / Ss-1) TaxID=665079 RepID=A7EPK9_SCLS1|nr:predicted protein [Sclerotinia sclerotiorum 1980 UF-70]EDO04775.1 predicted protein [Sclerotinia sclerotiorum 1980 UF-70]